MFISIAAAIVVYNSKRSRIESHALSRVGLRLLGTNPTSSLLNVRLMQEKHFRICQAHS